MTLSMRSYGSHAIGEARVHRELHAMRGESREDIDGPRFYDLVGRPDLANRLRRRRKLAYGGLGVAGAGLGVAIYGVATAINRESPDYNCDPARPDFGTCIDAEFEAIEDHNRGTMVYAGVPVSGAILSGAGLAIWRGLRRDPVPFGTRRGLADRHNRLLRERLGLEPTTASLRASVEPGGIGVTLSGTW